MQDTHKEWSPNKKFPTKKQCYFHLKDETDMERLSHLSKGIQTVAEWYRQGWKPSLAWVPKAVLNQYAGRSAENRWPTLNGWVVWYMSYISKAILQKKETLEGASMCPLESGGNQRVASECCQKLWSQNTLFFPPQDSLLTFGGNKLVKLELKTSS